MLVSVTTLTAIKYATIDGGRRVILNDNGTWKYVKSKIAIKPVEIGRSGAMFSVIGWKDNIQSQSFRQPKLGMRCFAVLLLINNKKGLKKIRINPLMGTFQLKDSMGFSYKVTIASYRVVDPEFPEMSTLET